MTDLMSNPYAIPYNLAIKILYITYLHFIDDQDLIFTVFITLAR